MAVTPFKFRKPKNVEIAKRLGVRAMILDSSTNFFLTLQDILNPYLSFIWNNILDFPVSYYCGRTLTVIITHLVMQPDVFKSHVDTFPA